jgi:hypothetical protein
MGFQLPRAGAESVAEARQMSEIGEDPEREERKKSLTDALRSAAADGPAVPGEIVDLDEDEQDGVEAVAPGGAPPEWATVPADFKMPDGWVVFFVRFRAKWTNRPGSGDRQCILWNLSESDEKRASARARGDGMRLVAEMAKQQIRAIDGERADWSGAPGPHNVSQFWSEIGGKCRYLLKGHYLKTHTMSTEETVDFFDNCVASRSVG